jgi:hypothetical protein
MAILTHDLNVWISLKMLCSKGTFADHHCLLNLLLDKLSIDERESDRFISRLVVCRSSDSSSNLTDSSLFTVDYISTTLPNLGFTFFVCTRSADLACTYYYYAIACNTAIKFLWLVALV